LQNEHIKLQEDVANLHSKETEGAVQHQELVKKLQNDIVIKAKQVFWLTLVYLLFQFLIHKHK